MIINKINYNAIQEWFTIPSTDTLTSFSIIIVNAIHGSFAFIDIQGKIFTLPIHLGGINIPLPTSQASLGFSASCKITALIVESIVNQVYVYDQHVAEAIHRTKV